MRSCPHCRDEAAAPYGTYKTRGGARQRFRCKTCGRTFSAATGAEHYRLQHPRAVFELVIALSRRGLPRGAIARATGVSWNTVARWQARAAGRAAREPDGGCPPDALG